MTVRTDPEQRDVEGGRAASSGPSLSETAAQPITVLEGGFPIRAALPLDPMDLPKGDLSHPKEGPLGQSVVAEGVRRLDHPLVGPEDLDLRPVEIDRILTSEPSEEPARGPAPGEDDARAPSAVDSRVEPADDPAAGPRRGLAGRTGDLDRDLRGQGRGPWGDPGTGKI